MKMMKWQGWLWIMAVLCAVVRPGLAQPTIASAVLARSYVNGAAKGVTNTFKPSDHELHCAVKLNHMAKVTARSVWIAVDAAGMKNYKIVEKQLSGQLGNTLHFSASLPRDWPVGKYRADIYLNGKLARSLPYTVK